MAYKSVRLLVDAIHNEMANLKKFMMQEVASPSLDQAQDTWIELRKLFDELGAKADRPTIDDITKLAPGDYVATMKPLVGSYHRQLMVADKLAPCLCEDLQAVGCILILVGDGKTIVRTAVDPNRPEIQLAVEAILESLDSGTKQVVTEGVAEAEKQLGITEDDFQPAGEAFFPGMVEMSIDERTRLLQEAERVGWDTVEGVELRERAKNYSEGEKLT